MKNTMPTFSIFSSHHLVFVLLIFFLTSSYLAYASTWVDNLLLWHQEGLVSDKELEDAMRYLSQLDAINSERNDSNLQHSQILLDVVPPVVREGDTVTFSGRLVLENDNPNGFVVLLKDRDGDSDDLLVTTVVDERGSFEAKWRAHRTDLEDDTVELYASFEGDLRHQPASTCGAECKEYAQIKILRGEMVSPDPTDTKHLSLHGAFWNDSVDVLVTVDGRYAKDAKEYISAVVEGTRIWEQRLAGLYPNGKWTINVDIQDQPITFFDSSKYDILTVITAGNDEACDAHYLGVTDFGIFHSEGFVSNMVTISDPCNPNRLLSKDMVSSAASHELGHALGLEHAVNVDYDLMCSGTCAKTDSSAIPSELDVRGLAYIYGEDGFSEPNLIPVERRGVKFYDDGDDSNNFQNTEETSKNLPSGFGIYENKKYGVSIQYPAGWITLEDVLATDSLDYIFRTRPSFSVDLTVGVILYYGTLGYDGLSDENYVEKLVSDHKEFCDGYSLETDDFECQNYVVEIADHDNDVYVLKSNWQLLKRDESVVPMVEHVITIPNDQGTWKLIIQSDGDSYAAYQDTIQNMIDSFSVRKIST